MENYVALLRGINVGGKNKLPMAELAKMVSACGCESVRTFINSGNVLFCASPKLANGVGAQVSAAVRKKFGFDVPVVLRSASEMQTAVQANPYAKRKGMEDFLTVMFLSDAPSAQTLKALDPQRSPGDEYFVQGREIYLWLPQGFAKTKLSNAYFDSKLGTVSTGRNWRTVTKLDAMLREPRDKA